MVPNWKFSGLLPLSYTPFDAVTTVIGLCDVNSFYASCEQIFYPLHRNKPIVVASNNDGCVVARSPEAKAMGIKMGQPIFQIQHLKSKGLIVRSSNYGLYADLSSRFIQTLNALCPAVMPYSIDEAFVDLSGMSKLIPLDEFGHNIKDTVAQWTGLPICVGISTTPTLAKLANHGAKKFAKTKGIVDLTSPDRQRRLLNITPVGDIWGVGSKLSARLNSLGIHTGLELAMADPSWIRTYFSIVLERTVKELNGIQCIEVEEVAPTKQQIMCSKSFGADIQKIEDMNVAVSQYATRAAEKLRIEKREAGHLTVFVSTSRFRGDQYSNGLSTKLHPTSDTRTIVQAALALTKTMWRQGYNYNKAGVMLGDFKVPGVIQEDFFDVAGDSEKSERLMQTMDKINQVLGKESVMSGRQAQSTTHWEMKRGNLSPSYTTQWTDIPKAKC